jgi:hypothetical protein
MKQKSQKRATEFTENTESISCGIFSVRSVFSVAIGFFDL